MALKKLTRTAFFYSSIDKEGKVLASILKRSYSTKDPKKITHIPQNPEDCGCTRLPKLKSSKTQEKLQLSKRQEKQRTKHEEECEETQHKKTEEYEETQNIKMVKCEETQYRKDEECEEMEHRKIEECEETQHQKTEECEETQHRKIEECEETQHQKTEECEETQHSKIEECEKPQQRRRKECEERQHHKTHKEDTDYCYQQPPSPQACQKEAKEKKKDCTKKVKQPCYQQSPSAQACSQKSKTKEKEHIEEHEYGKEDCNDEVERDYSQPKQTKQRVYCQQKSKETNCSQSKMTDCNQSKPKKTESDHQQQPNIYQKVCSKIKQAHIYKQREKAQQDCQKSPSASKVQAKISDCCQSNKEEESGQPKKTMCNENKTNQKVGSSKSKNKGNVGDATKSTALYCAKCISEKKAEEIQSCLSTKPTVEKLKTTECVLGKKNTDSKPVCKNKEKQRETCSKPVNKDCTKSEEINLKELKVRTINPCDPTAKPKGCTVKTEVQETKKSKGKLLKILGIPALLLIIAGLIYEYGPPPPPDPPVST